MNYSLYIKLFIFRLINGLILRTYYSPDEYWQSQEIAYSDVYSRGYRAWEWNQEQPIRSPFYHYISFTILFKVLKTVGLDFPNVIAYSPRVIQAFYSAFFDYFVIRLFNLLISKQIDSDIEKIPVQDEEQVTSKTKKKGKYVKKQRVPTQAEENRKIVLIVLYCNWFSLFAVPRTIINSFEALLFTIGLFYWEKYQVTQSFNDNLICRLFVSLNFIARPTSIIPWVLIWPYELLQVINKANNDFTKVFGKLIRIIILNITNLVFMSFASIFIDIIYFGKITWTAYNFLQFNLIQSGAELYGVHGFGWYFMVGIPYLLLGFVIFFIQGVVESFGTDKQRLIWYTVFPILFMSLSKHKEDRFLLPLYPLVIYFVGLGFFKMSKKYSKLVLYVAFLSNALLYMYLGFKHNSGSLPVMDVLREKLNKHKNTEENINVLFLTECHQTPYHSFLHIRDSVLNDKINLRFPDCSPEFRKTGNSESIQLFREPQVFTEKILEDFDAKYIVVYSNLLEEKLGFLKNSAYNYKEIYSIYHSILMETPLGEIQDVSFILLEKQKKQN